MRTYRTTRVRSVAGLVMALICEGCHHATPPAPPSPAPTPQPIAAPEEHQKNFAAMLVVLANAYWRGNPPAALHMESLGAAVERLNDPAVLAWDRTAVSRRRRAIATLAAYGLGAQPIEDALRALGAPVEDIKQQVDEQGRLLGAAFTENAAARQTFIADLPEVSRRHDTACASPEPSEANCWNKLSTRIYPGRMVSIVVEVEAHNSVGGVAKGLDPQSWDQCGTAWKTGNGTFFAHLDNANNVVRDPELIPPGQAFPKAFLYENFLCQLGFCRSNFELFLGVQATRTPNLYHADFWLEPQGGYPKGTVYGVNEQLLYDQGYLEVKPSSVVGTSLVHGEKGIIFKTESVTAAVFTFLEYTELSTELGELACCFIE